jgi:hypothetical protein
MTSSHSPLCSTQEFLQFYCQNSVYELPVRGLSTSCSHNTLRHALTECHVRILAGKPTILMTGFSSIPQYHEDTTASFQILSNSQVILPPDIIQPERVPASYNKPQETASPRPNLYRYANSSWHRKQLTHSVYTVKHVRELRKTDSDKELLNEDHKLSCWYEDPASHVTERTEENGT